jgi:hypothetical protein
MMGYCGDGVKRAAAGVSVLVALFVIFSSSGVYSATINSTADYFNMTPRSLYLNWTNDYMANITLGMWYGASYINITIDNATTIVSGNYTQRDSFGVAGYPKYYPSNRGCFDQVDTTKDSPFLMQNGSGVYSNVTHLRNSGQLETDARFVMDYVCPPGRYWGIINITNTTNASVTGDNVNLTLQVDIPISTANELNSTTGVGRFGGTMPANAATYHYYYFNTSNVTNATSITVNLTWADMSKDIDIFLFDSSGSLMAKSIDRGQNESLYYGHLPKDETWEIRVYGNLSASEKYAGLVYISLLNASKNYDLNSLADMLDFGSMNPSQRVEKNITLRNGVDYLLQSVVQSMEVYHLEYFTSNESIESENKTFILPLSATRVRASVNWSGASDYNITLYSPGGTIMGTSTNKSATANKTGAVQEEFVDISNGLAEGIWTVNVRNDTTVGLDAFNIIVKYWVPASSWIQTNYTTIDINNTGNENDTRTIHINLTAQNITTSGQFGGSLKYRPQTGTILSIPIRANVTVPMLMANNTFNNKTVVFEDNIGINKTITFNITLQNKGNANMASITASNSSGQLRSGSNRLNFTFDYPSSLDAGESALVNVTFNINELDTSHNSGIYTGWIVLNSSAARPYDAFNISMRFNLSNKLRINIISVLAPNGFDNIEEFTQDRNLTIKLKVYYLNGTEITDIPNLSNFSVRLEETNISAYKVPSSGYLTTSKARANLYQTDAYYLNSTVPANRSGGRYYTNVSLTYSAASQSFTGKAGQSSVSINRSGLYLGISRTSLTITEGTTSGIFLNVSAINYGVIDASGTIGLDYSGDSSDCSLITFGRPDDAYIDAKDASGSNTQDFDEAEWDDIEITANGSMGWYRWKFSAANTSSDKVCTLKVNSSNPTLNNKTFLITINAIEGTTDDSTTTSGGGADDTSTNIYNYSVDITDFPDTFNVILGESNTTNITVKNNGNMSTEVKVSVSINGGITATVSPESWYIPWGGTREYTITFDVSDSATLGEHTGTFKAMVTIKTDKYNTETFKFNVLSTPERESELSSSYDNYSLEFDDVVANFTAIKNSGLLPVENLTSVEILINDTLNILRDIKAALDRGDYATAETLLSEMKSNINRVKADIESLSTEKEKAAEAAMGGLWVWVVVGVIIAAVAGLFVYMMLPIESGFSMKYGYKSGSPGLGSRIPGMGKPKSFIEKIKEFFNKILKRKKESRVQTTVKSVKKYAGGYRKQNPTDYKFKKK